MQVILPPSVIDTCAHFDSHVTRLGFVLSFRYSKKFLFIPLSSFCDKPVQKAGLSVKLDHHHEAESDAREGQI